MTGSSAWKAGREKGRAFHLFFPAIVLDNLPEGAQKGDFARGKGSILFVDDEELLVEMNQGRLEGLGYEVVTETSASQALDLFRDDPDRFDLVITDYTMPHMTGLELAREVLLLKPEIPVILCSGLDELLPMEVVKAAGIREFLPKAVGKRDLVNVVQRLIGNR